jgi:hypothetical protein
MSAPQPFQPHPQQPQYNYAAPSLPFEPGNFFLRFIASILDDIIAGMITGMVIAVPFSGSLRKAQPAAWQARQFISSETGRTMSVKASAVPALFLGVVIRQDWPVFAGEPGEGRTEAHPLGGIGWAGHVEAGQASVGDEGFAVERE